NLEQITFNFGPTSFPITFSDGGGGPDTVTYNGPQTPGVNSSPAQIANTLRAVLEASLPLGVSVGSFNDRVMVYGNGLSIDALADGSQILTDQFQALEITVPEGIDLNDRDTIDIDIDPPGDSVVRTIPIVLRDLSPAVQPIPGPFDLGFLSTDAAADVRDGLIPLLSPFAVPPRIDAANNRVLVVGADFNTDVPPPGIAVGLEPVISFDLSGEQLRTGEIIE
ncbi:unnamed protein product, partial [Hapterophycus canaliculatus]